MKVNVILLSMLTLVTSQGSQFFNRGFRNTNTQFMGSDSNTDSVVLFLNDHHTSTHKQRPLQGGSHQRSPRPITPQNRPQDAHFHHRPQDKTVFGRSSMNYVMSIPPPDSQQMRKLPQKLSPYVIKEDLATVVIPNSLQLHSFGHVPKPRPQRISMKYQSMSKHRRPDSDKFHEKRKPSLNIQPQQRHPSSNANAGNKEGPSINVRYLQPGSHNIRDGSQEPIAYITVEHHAEQTPRQPGSGQPRSNGPNTHEKRDNRHIQNNQPRPTPPPQKTQMQQQVPSSGTSSHTNRINQGTATSNEAFQNSVSFNPTSQGKPKQQQQYQATLTTTAAPPIQYTTVPTIPPPNTISPIVHSSSNFDSSGRVAAPAYGSAQVSNTLQSVSPNFQTTYSNNGNAVQPNTMVAVQNTYQTQAQQNVPLNFASSTQQHTPGSYLPTSVGQITFVQSGPSSSSAQNGYTITTENRPQSTYAQQAGQITYVPATQSQASTSVQTLQHPNYISYVPDDQRSYAASQTGEAPVQNYGASVQALQMPYTPQTGQENYAPTLQTDQTQYAPSSVGQSAYTLQQQNNQNYEPNSDIKKYTFQQQPEQTLLQTHITQQTFTSPQEALQAAYAQHQAAQTNQGSQNQPTYIPSSTSSLGDYGSNVQQYSYSFSNPADSHQAYAISAHAAQNPLSSGRNIGGTYEPSSQISASSQNENQASYVIRPSAQQQSEDLTYAPSNSQKFQSQPLSSTASRYGSAQTEGQKSNSGEASYSDETRSYSVPQISGSYSSTGIITPGSTYGKALKKNISSDQYSSYQQQASTEDKRENTEDGIEDNGEDEDPATYKVVYIPLDVLKNILSNSVDPKNK